MYEKLWLWDIFHYICMGKPGEARETKVKGKYNRTIKEKNIDESYETDMVELI